MAKTFTSDVFRVVYRNEPAVLKVLNEKGRQFELRGAAVLQCFNGNGAVRLLQADEGAHLLEYVDGQPLKLLVEGGDDDRATKIVCEVVQKLHAYQGPIPAELISMERNFRSLFEKVKADPNNTFYMAGANLARELIASARDLRVLHGDIHHENILESATRGWLVIDPQCLAGERAYDLANVFYNPRGFFVSREIIESRVDIFASELGLERRRILQYAFAYGCLSATWCIQDGQSPEETLRIAEIIQEMIN